jgi:DNA-binding NtrC family response regulator
MPRLPDPGRFVARTLAASPAPLFALDGQRRIVFANQALAVWLGVEADQLLGRRCDFAADPDDSLQAVCGALCPPPEAFAGQVSDGFVSRLAKGELPFQRRGARFIHVASDKPGELLLLVIVQPVEDAVQSAPQDALNPHRLHAALIRLRSDLGCRFNTGQLIGESLAIQRIRQQARLAASSDVRVLIVGPPGSGREHVARTIQHAPSGATIGPLIPIACPLVNAEQMQAALASVIRRQQDTPTDVPAAALLLDIDRLHPEAQQELAGFLHLPKIELRTIATARGSLQRLAARGKFRRDLAHDLATLTLRLPPLARRREDIPLLAQHFLEKVNLGADRQLSGFHSAAIELLASLPWPGNIDQLADAVRQACGRAVGPRIMLADLPDWVHLAHDAAARSPRNDEPIQLDAFLADIEKELLARALKKAGGNKSKAAALLGLSRPRLLRRLAQLGLIAPAEAEEPVVFVPLPDGT